MARLEKKIVSQYFRTKCDKYLLFSLCRKEKKLPNKEPLPEPIKSRPQIAQVTTAGRNLEAEKYQVLRAAFPTQTYDFSQQHKKMGQADLIAWLQSQILPMPSFLIETPISSNGMERFFYENVGAPSDGMPMLADFRPDVIRVLAPGERISDDPLDEQREVLATGKTRSLYPNDTRCRLAVIDVKNSEHGNPSYAAEVVMYSLVLANWLAFHGLDNKYVVTNQCALWVRGGIDESSQV